MAYFIQSALFSCIYTVYLYLYIYTRRIHGAGIYANIWGILMGSMLPYIAYMDPMGYINTSPNRQGKKRPGVFFVSNGPSFGNSTRNKTLTFGCSDILVYIKMNI
jgi:hypothetical protein